MCMHQDKVFNGKGITYTISVNLYKQFTCNLAYCLIFYGWKNIPEQNTHWINILRSEVTSIKVITIYFSVSVSITFHFIKQLYFYVMRRKTIVKLSDSNRQFPNLLQTIAPNRGWQWDRNAFTVISLIQPRFQPVVRAYWNKFGKCL